MNLADKLSELDEKFPAGWTIQRRDKSYYVILLEDKSESVFCSDASASIKDAIKSALDKSNKGKDLFSEMKMQSVFKKIHQP